MKPVSARPCRSRSSLKRYGIQGTRSNKRFNRGLRRLGFAVSQPRKDGSAAGPISQIAWSISSSLNVERRPSPSSNRELESYASSHSDKRCPFHTGSLAGKQETASHIISPSANAPPARAFDLVEVTV